MNDRNERGMDPTPNSSRDPLIGQPGSHPAVGSGVALDPTAEDGYWRDNYMKRPYYRSSKSYSDYQPAYRFGWESAARSEFRGRPFEDAEPDLEIGWERAKGSSREKWYEIRDAARDAWDRIRR